MNKRVYAVLVICTVLAAALCLSGCVGQQSQPQVTVRAATSYVAAETAVYSSTAEVVKAVADSVVEISTESVTTRFGQQYIVSGAGSGVIVAKTEEGYFVVTNNHVVEDANNITLRTRAGLEYSATVVAADDSADIAVVEVLCRDELSLAVWGNSDELQIGEDVIAIGNPLGNLGGTVTKGIVSATDRTIAVGDFAMTLLQTDAAINPGNSGGGLFNMRGQLVGIVNAKTSEEGIEGLCFAIPANAARQAYNSLCTLGYLEGRATLDITLAETSSSTQTLVYVSALGQNADSGFRVFDRLFRINGIEVTSVLDYNTIMAGVHPGDTLTVEVYRGTLSSGLWGSTLSFSSQSTVLTVQALQYM